MCRCSSILGPVTYQVQEEVKIWKRHINQLKNVAFASLADLPNADKNEEITNPMEDKTVVSSVQNFPENNVPVFTQSPKHFLQSKLLASYLSNTIQFLRGSLFIVLF